MAPSAYAPPRFDAAIDLDLSRNEGIAPTTMQIDPNMPGVVGRYPDTTELRRRLAERHGVPESRVLVTAGADGALLRCFLARLGSGRQAVATYPTFEMIPRYAQQVGARLVEVPWWGGPFPVDRALSAVTRDTEVVFVVSPNNPTGAVLTADDLQDLAEAVPLVVLDAAYGEFADHDVTSAALEMGNVAVIRTLSKAWGLAGLRVGYVLGSDDLVQELSAFGSPFSVSSLSAALALTRLGQEEEVSEFVQEVVAERAELTVFLENVGARPLPSQGNFVLAEFSDAEWVVSAAASMGIALRRFPDRAGLENRVRITLPGDRQAFDRLIETLRAVLRPEAWLFDLDGVLADVTDSQIRAIVETALSFGLDVAQHDIEEMQARGEANDDWDLTRQLLVEGGVDASIEDVVGRYEAIYQGVDGISGLKRNERPLVDIATWERWAATRPIGVVTGRPRRDAEEFLNRFGLLGAISVLITKEDAPAKPSPAPVELALAGLGVTRAWMLGDTRDDIVAARQAGVIPLAVVAAGHTRSGFRPDLSMAARVLTTTLEMEGLLK